MIQSFILALYHHESIPLSKEIDWYRDALEDIEHFAISPQVLYLLQQRHQLHDTPLFFQQALKQQSQKAYFQNVFIKKKMEPILDSFEKACIPVIPLKGIYFTEKYFGHLGARWTSDIDLLIKPSDTSRAIACIQSLGFTLEEEPIPSHFHVSFSKPLPHSSIPLVVELHWDLLKNNTSHLEIEEFWNEATPIGSNRYVRELSDYHTFYMICLHGWRHQLNSLKYFLDILQTGHLLGQKLDWARLLKDTVSHKTFNRMRQTLAIVHQQFPQPDLVPFPIPIRRTSWWEYQAIRDHHYKTYKQYLNLFCFEFLHFDSITDTLRFLLKWLVPSRDVLAYELGSKQPEHMIGINYLRLYRQRAYYFFKTLSKITLF